MINTIYLNGAQVALMKEQGVNLASLSWKKLQDLLNKADYLNILNTTCSLQAPNGFLNVLGLKDNCHDWIFEDSNPVSLPIGIVLNAVGGDDNTVIVWPEESEYNNIHDMYKHSRMNILKALTKIMIFKELKYTPIFEAAFKAEG